MYINTEKWRTLDRSIDYGTDYSYSDTNLYSLDISYKPIVVRIGRAKFG